MKHALDPRVLSAGLLSLGLILGSILLFGPVQGLDDGQTLDQTFQNLILIHATLPRLVMCVLCGIGLGISGAILQQVLRNPLAAPDTLAVSAGARLALGLVTVFAPGLFGIGRDLIAIAGALASTVIVLTIARARQYSPISTILAGLVVSLYCGALATILVLAKDRYLVGLFIWGSGSLSQQSWQPALDLGLRLILTLLPLALLMRPLSVLDAGPELARIVGVRVERVRLYAIGLAVLLAAFVTSAVGVIGFIGLAAPALVSVGRIQRFPSRCIWSGIMGALILLVTDICVQLAAGKTGAFFPTGAVTAVIGSPLLLLLLSRMRTRPHQQDLNEPAFGPQALSQRWTLPVYLALGGGLAGLTIVLLLIGRAPDGSWYLLGPNAFADVLPWRLPRMLGAAGAGGLLAIAGYILQRVTRNPMASPEIMGVSAGAVLGAAATLFLFGGSYMFSLTASTVTGSFVALLFVLAISARRSAAPERILLAGVALSALADALVGLLMASGSPSAVLLLAWMSGSSAGIGLPAAAMTAAAAVILLCVAFLGSRWLKILPLGGSTALSLGVPVVSSRLLLFVLAAVMTAIATPIIGPITFVGLMAPHAVRLSGIRSVPAGLALSALVGALLMTLADALARTIAFPMQLPTGILASLLAGPILLYLIAHEGRPR
ncbi:Fe(3+)-hydroxamate ABC transporter permease FhuB [Henriciella aquimarina]|uniref:Fe(3+)-hydroxamate ABC transporter permease FhuB n=1 Tax=Henriciella aquimarina TaxID=545261 RepID=UPI000A02DFFE|nr:Fe(3+)-hydroxamate ABC transporter permease FhuB [Henriciella aquimarina]